MKKLLTFIFSISILPSFAQVNPKLQTKIDQQARELEANVIQWRRHFHEFPELSNREVKTGAYIAEHLKKLGLEVQYPVAKTGVVALLKGSEAWACNCATC
jgi:metal-dependent amidase/aminoacylase/carboxypeptidase family protein